MNIKFEGTVIKRSGQKVHFDRERLVNAITKANGDVSEDLRMTKTQIDRIVDQITINCMDLDHIVSVEELQDMVEDKIMQHGAFEVARAYIKYRYNRELSRKANTTDDKILSLMERSYSILKDHPVNLKRKSEGKNPAKAENANKNPVVNSTQRDYMAGEVSRDLTERILLPKDIVEAHKNGIIHFHDSDYYSQKEHNCDLIDLEDMLQNGTVITETLIEKPHSFYTACNVTTQIIAQVASNQYGLTKPAV